MIIENLQLQNFRNYQELQVEFSPHLNIFVGENAQGKTNILEAIFLLAMARSHRSNKDREVIQWGQDVAKVQAQAQNKRTDFSLEIILSKKGKIARLNQWDQAKLSDYIGHLNVIMFAPEDLDIVKGSPSVRRRFIDMELGQISPLYLHHLAQYNQVLKQRNSYLKNGLKLDELYLNIISDQMAQEAAYIYRERISFIRQLEHWSQAIHHNISDHKENLALSYVHSVNFNHTEDFDDLDSIFQAYRAQLEKNKEREIERRSSLLGPHRDDLNFFINGHNVQIFASQGQQRTTSLSLRLAEINLIEELTGECPILLLDDVLSELDNFRQTYLLQTIENKIQTFLTTTNLDGINQKIIDNAKIFKIYQGQVETEG